MTVPHEVKRAVLNSERKTPSESEKLINLVIGSISASRQDLSRFVGIKSREQVALYEERITRLTSSLEQG